MLQWHLKRLENLSFYSIFCSTQSQKIFWSLKSTVTSAFFLNLLQSSFDGVNTTIGSDFPAIDGGMQSAMLFRGSGDCCGYSWDWLQFLAMDMLLYLVSNLDSAIRHMFLLITQKYAWPRHTPGVGVCVLRRQCPHCKPFFIESEHNVKHYVGWEAEIILCDSKVEVDA